MSKHNALWVSPAPFWGRFAPVPDSAEAFIAKDQAAPAILRFATDDFMDQMLSTLAADPKQIGSLIARPETWRNPSGDGPDLAERTPLPRLARTLARLRAGKTAATSLESASHEVAVKEKNTERKLPLKLYQPAHQRHYLVTANLVCGRLGFPDREVADNCEQAGFVLRRLRPLKDDDAGPPFEEYAFVKDTDESRWQRIEPDANLNDPVATLAPGEELLPLFPLNFHDDNGHPRRLLTGVVPVGRREEYMSTKAQREAPIKGGGNGSKAKEDPTAISARKEQFKMEVTEPWKNLIRSAVHAANRIMDENAGSPMGDKQAARESAAKSANNQAQGQSWLILLDFADFLQQHLKPVWGCVAGVAGRNSLTSDAQRNLFDWLNNTDSNRGVTGNWQLEWGGRQFAYSLCDALKKIRVSENVRDGLEGATCLFPETLDDGLAWPGFAYLLAGVRGSGSNYEAWGIHSTLPNVTAAPEDEDAKAPAIPPVLQQAETQAAKLDKLVQLVIKAIDLSAPAEPAPPLPFAARLRDALKTTEGDPGWFVMRCVYLRCDCGPLQAAILSAPTQRFQLASFFDPDAPARPIRISLPLDTTPAGMRKHSKNTAFIISDVLCGQIQRAKGLGLGDLVRSVLPWPLHKDLDVGGMGPCKKSGPKEINIGMICSLSIPIITICALILLMIIVSLLDFIFRWLPYFIMCFPIPGLKAKKDK